MLMQITFVPYKHADRMKKAGMRLDRLARFCLTSAQVQN